MQFKIQPKINHRRQEKSYSCGAAAIAMLFGANEAEIRKEVKTDSNGTHDYDVYQFLKRVGLECHQIHLKENYYKFAETLKNLSFKFPIYAGSSYRDRYYVKGRDRNRQHAILICDGLFYDPSEKKGLTFESYESVFNKSMIINHFIIIDEERPDYLKNIRKEEFLN